MLRCGNRTAAWSSERWGERWRCEGHPRKATRIVTALPFHLLFAPGPLRRFSCRSANERHSNSISGSFIVEQYILFVSLPPLLPRAFQSQSDLPKHAAPRTTLLELPVDVVSRQSTIGTGFYERVVFVCDLNHPHVSFVLWRWQCVVLGRIISFESLFSHCNIAHETRIFCLGMIYIFFSSFL